MINQAQEMKTALFNRFEIEMPIEAARECSHPGECDVDVKNWAPHIKRPHSITPETLAAELHEYGAWTDYDLKNDAQNWERIVWIAASNINEESISND